MMMMVMMMPLMAPPTPTNLLLPLLPLWFMLFLVMAGPASASAPAPPPPPPPPPIMSSTSVNITQIIESAGGFDTFVSLLTATGVDRLFQSQANKMTTGITIFAPTDRAFSTVSSSSSSSDGSGSGMISKLPARLKITLLEFHALSAFYALSALQQAADPVTPTLATDEAGAGKFTVNVTNVDGTVYVSTGLSRSAITSTLYNSVPCGVFAVDQVLLPEEIFGHPVAPAPAPAPSSSSSSSSSSSADISPSPREYPSKIPTVSSSPASPFGIPTNLSSSSSSSSYPPPPPLDNEPTPSPCAGLAIPHLLHTTLLLLLVLNTNMMNKMWLDSF